MIPREIVMTLVMVFCLTPVVAQFIDHFDDDDFANDPTWQGTDSRFVVSGGRLKLQAPASAGTAFLATASEAIYEGNWNVSLQLDFTPSSTNYAKVYLVSDHADLSIPLNGYFIKVGGTTREVSLYRQSGTTETKLIDGVDDRVNSSVVMVRVKAERDATGKWALFTDVGNTGNWTSEGAVEDLTYTESSWFGIACTYTSTRSDKFWFDDVEVSGSTTPDTTPPVLAKLEVLDALHFLAEFSEPLDPSSASLQAVTIQVLGSPTTITLVDQTVLACTMPTPLTNGVTYSAVFTQLSDLHGNVIVPVSVPLLYFQPGIATWKSVLINEFLPDPSPQVGLPAAEFVELYNAGQEPLDLAGWSLTDGSSVGRFPSVIFLPGEYRIVTATASSGLFPISRVIGLTNFPSLNNAGDRLILSDDNNALIDSVNYMQSWFRDEDKEQGGWSLELIDPTNPCGEEDNWVASESALGGTPGELNSVFASKPDLTGPRVLSLHVVSEERLTLVFNEALRSSTVDEAEIVINPPAPISWVSVSDPARRKITVDLAGKLLSRTSYGITLKGISDCSGNLMESTELSFGLSEPAETADVRISEVLFNPRSGGVDFVELINASQKFIELDGATITNEESEFMLPAALLHPGDRIAITPNPDILRSQYPQSAKGPMLKATLPSLPDDEGTIRIISSEGTLLDELHYDHDWHSALLKNENGVSLERIDLQAVTQDQENWTSASSRAGYATPGIINSQEFPGVTSSQDEVSVSPEIFSPGEYALIHYQLETPGKIGNIEVYNYYGQRVKGLGNNELLGMEGFFRWDGDRDDGSQAAMGYYVVRFEIFDPSGYVNTHLKRVIVTRR